MDSQALRTLLLRSVIDSELCNTDEDALIAAVEAVRRVAWRLRWSLAIRASDYQDVMAACDRVVEDADCSCVHLPVADVRELGCGA